MIVVDASILVDALSDDGERGRNARGLLRDAGSLAAPAHVDSETMSALRRRWLGGRITERRFAEAVDVLADLPVQRSPTARLLHRAFELRSNVTPFDACYVALAELRGVELWTRDERLARATGSRCAIRVL